MAGPSWTGLLIWEQLFITGLFHGVHHCAGFCLSFSRALDGEMAWGHIVCSELECCHASQWFALCNSTLWKKGNVFHSLGREELNVISALPQCRMSRIVCGREELRFSTVGILKWYLSTGFNVSLQSASIHQGFRMLFNVVSALRWSTFTNRSSSTRITVQCRLCYGMRMFNSLVTRKEPKAISHGQIPDCCSELNYLPYIPTICKVTKASHSKSACNTTQWFFPY